MCYFLYGGINKGIDADDYNKKIACQSHFFLNAGTESDIKLCIENCQSHYRITRNVCDCKSKFGSHDVEGKDLLEFIEFINQIRTVKGIKHIFISKNWWKHKTEKEVTVHIDDINFTQYLADIEDDCLYKIQLFKKYN